MTALQRQQVAVRVTGGSITVGVVLAGFKLFAGIYSNSAAMVSDAIHSVSDFAATIVVMVGIRMASKESDAEHQYGHERMESVACLIVAVVLCMTGLWIGFGGVSQLATSQAQGYPGVLALVAAISSISIKEAMFWFVRGAAKAIDSEALMADAWHHRSDGLSSVGSLAGIIGARAGFPVLDHLASIVICVFIVKASLDISKDALKKLTDHSCDIRTLEAIRGTILANEGVLEIEELRTRMFGSRIYVDAELCFDGNLSLYDTYAIAKQIHDDVEESIPGVKHCMIHVKPYNK